LNFVVECFFFFISGGTGSANDFIQRSFNGISWKAIIATPPWGNKYYHSTVVWNNALIVVTIHIYKYI
jgi:hypothetical protein